MVNLERYSLIYKIIIDPIHSFNRLKYQEFGYSTSYILTVGWITAILSGFLSLYGVDYSNPSNTGGSAQLFASWVLKIINYEKDCAIRVIAFASLVMFGYLVLAFISAPIIASVAWLLMGRLNYLELCSLAFNAVAYGMTPGFLFGWIPNPFYIVGLWATFWQYLAVKEMLNLSWSKVLVVIMLWLIIMGLLHDLAGFLITAII